MSAVYNYSDLNIAVIGCGNWGKNHIRVFHSLGALYTICDAHPKQAAALSEQFSVPAAHLDEILASPHIHGCVIATPAKTHFEIAKRCLEAKKHVFIEKPIVTQSYQADYLQQLAAEKKRVLMVGHLLHYHDGFQALKNLVMNQELGNIYHITANRFTFGRYSTESSVIWDVAPHDVSVVLALMGELPYQVMATSSYHLPNRTDDFATLELKFSQNRQAQITSSWIHPTKEQKLTVIGDKAMAVFDDTLPWENKLQLFSQLDALPAVGQSHPLLPSEPLKNECSHFLDCILQNLTPRTNAKEGFYVTQVLEAAIASIEQQKPIRLTVETPNHVSTLADNVFAEIP